MTESSVAMESSAEECTLRTSPQISDQPKGVIDQMADPQGHDIMMTTLKAIEDNPMVASDKNIENTIKAIGQEMKTACLQWDQLMVESEHFELFCPTRVDKLLQEAQAIEAHLLRQKEQLIDRLRNLSQTLKVVP